MMAQHTDATLTVRSAGGANGVVATDNTTQNRADTSRTSSAWKKVRQEKIRSFLRENGPKRPVAPFLMYYMEKAREARELAANSSTKRIPLDRTRLAEEFENLSAEKKLCIRKCMTAIWRLTTPSETNLNSNRYMEFVHKLDTKVLSRINF